MAHKLDRLGKREYIVSEFKAIAKDVIHNDCEMAPCQYLDEHRDKNHTDCQIFEWLGYSAKLRPSMEKYEKISKIILVYLERFQPDPIPWDLIKELVNNESH